MNKENKLGSRRSGIELLKIIAIFMIVISHVTQTLSSENIHYTSDYVINITQATTSIQQLILSFIYHMGAQGNLIFFTCSAWFLLKSEKVNSKKILHMLVDVWAINLIFLFIVGATRNYDIAFTDVIKSLLPSTFACNWYITCYILFYSIHVWLNWIIEKLLQKQLLSSCIIMIGLYFGLNYIKSGLFFCSELITFIVIYFIIAYIKLYMIDFCQNIQKNIVICLIGIFGGGLLTLLTNYLGLHMSLFANKVTHWGGNNSPFLLMIAISLFNIFNNTNFRNIVINYVSGLSLLVYLLHENLLFRRYIRQQIWIYLYHTFGHRYVLFWVLVYAVLLFSTSILMAMLYKMFIQKWLYRISDKCSDKIPFMYGALCDRIIKFK